MKDINDSSEIDEIESLEQLIPDVDMEIVNRNSSRRIKKRPSQRLKQVHFATDDDGEIIEHVRYITPRNSMSMDKLERIWNILDKDEDNLLNFEELFHFASTV